MKIETNDQAAVSIITCVAIIMFCLLIMSTRGCEIEQSRLRTFKECVRDTSDPTLCKEALSIKENNNE